MRKIKNVTGDDPMEEMKVYRLGNAVIRIHGNVDMNNIREATAAFAKKVFANEKKQEKQEAS